MNLFWSGLVLLFCITTASALSLSIPDNRHFTFEPYTNITVFFTVHANDGIDQEVTFYANGELGQYVRFEPTNTIFLKAGEAYTFAAIFELPEQIAAGEHIPVIGASGKKPAGKETIGATTAVQVRIFIRGRHPGKYIRPHLELLAESVEKPMKVVLNYENLGSETINEAASILDVHDLAGKLVGTLRFNPVSVDDDSSRRVEGIFETQGMSKGRYYANLTMLIDGKVVENAAAQEFRLGDREVLITGHDQHLEEAISLMRINVSSEWNQELEQVYVVAELHKGNGETTSFQTPSVTLKGFQTLTLEGYLNLTNVSLGSNTVKARVHYTLEDLTRDYPLEVTIVRKSGVEQPKIFTDRTVLVLVMATMILILLNIVWFIYLNRVRHSKTP